MELPIYSTTSALFQRISTWVDPFLEDTPEQAKAYIMPLYHVEQTLHHHYVKQTPVKVTYEYYNQAGRMVTDQVNCLVHTTVDMERRIVLNELDSQRTFILPIEQILRVEAS